ncbi:hypothetical protein HK100_012370 [Physocladia obscura]|uniref:Mitochondrial carrier protein n=1 Tax=Physocladia obscura TaxID=109957 RepID=A0AAD5T1B3_9FUNG|nr:hypothetical protein HK100_012370 [Physocladia obscura]
MVLTNGITSVFRGLGPTLLRYVSFSAIYWSSYEQIKRQFSTAATATIPKNDFATNFTSGATAGVIAACRRDNAV